MAPGIKTSKFSAEEDQLLFELHTKHGAKWSEIAKHLPGRTGDQVTKQWNSNEFQKKYYKKQNFKNFKANARRS